MRACSALVQPRLQPRAVARSVRAWRPHSQVCDPQLTRRCGQDSAAAAGAHTCSSAATACTARTGEAVVLPVACKVVKPSPHRQQALHLGAAGAQQLLDGLAAEWGSVSRERAQYTSRIIIRSGTQNSPTPAGRTPGGARRGCPPCSLLEASWPRLVPLSRKPHRSRYTIYAHTRHSASSPTSGQQARTHPLFTHEWEVNSLPALMLQHNPLRNERQTLDHLPSAPGWQGCPR